MSSIGKMTLCLMEAIGRTLLRFPWLIWIEVKILLCFESVLFQDDCPYFLGKLFSGNGFIPKCITKFAICTWCALNTASSCFLFLVSPFSLHLSPNRFLFRNFPTFFPFFFFFFHLYLQAMHHWGERWSLAILSPESKPLILFFSFRWIVKKEHVYSGTSLKKSKHHSNINFIHGVHSSDFHRKGS